MKSIKQLREATLKEEHGAGEFGTTELTKKYKDATPGQSSNVTEGNFKVTFSHEHPEGQKKHEYVVKATHQNAADHKAIALHRKAHPNGKFSMWDSQQIDEDAVEETAGQESMLAAQASAEATRHPSRENHLKAVAAHKNAQGFFKGQAHDYHLNKAMDHAKKASEMKEDTESPTSAVDEAHKLGDKVKIVGGPKDVQGKIGRIGEIRHGLHKTAAKTYTVDHDGGSIQLGKEHIRAVNEDAAEDMAKHHDAAQAAKKAGDNDAFHKHMDAKFAIAQKRDAENAKKPVSRLGEALEDACWKGYEAIGMKMKNGRKVPNCVPEETVTEDTALGRSNKAAKFSQKATENPSIATHIKASTHHAKAAGSYEKKIAAHIKSGGNSEDLKPYEDKVKHHNRSATLHKFLAHRLVKSNVNESLNEAPEDKLNTRITKHEQLAINAEKRGDKAAQAFHLGIVNKLKAGGVHEGTDHDDDQEEIIMAKGQLLKIADMAKDLADSMDDQDELEAWIQSKITTAYDQMDDVHSYVEYTQDLYDDQPEAEKEFTTESIIEPSVNDAKELARMRMLVRLGLLDPLKLNTVTRAIRKLDNNIPVTTIAEKDVLFELLQNLIDSITNDDTVFRKVKFNVAAK